MSEDPYVTSLYFKLLSHLSRDPVSDITEFAGPSENSCNVMELEGEAKEDDSAVKKSDKKNRQEITETSRFVTYLFYSVKLHASPKLAQIVILLLESG